MGNQCDEVIKLLAEEIWEEYPEVATMLVYKRYVDDFGQSTSSMKATEELIEKTTKDGSKRLGNCRKSSSARSL